MEHLLRDLIVFKTMFDQPVVAKPAIPTDKEKEFRKSLITEEYQELITAMDNKDLTEVADGMADLIYVVIGTALSYGIDLRDVWNEVHESNMEKISDPQRTNGKGVKPKGWKPPNILYCLKHSSLEDLIAEGISVQVRKYMNLPYTITLTPAEEGRFVAAIPELPGCFSEGDDIEETYASICEAQENWIKAMIEQGRQVPLPKTPWERKDDKKK